MIPAAILEMIIRYFGSGAHPDYSRTLGILERDPYRSVREALLKRWDVFDLTDPNSDLAFVYALKGHPLEATVRLSVVAPYGFAHNAAGAELADPELLAVLSGEGFMLLTQALLDMRVTYWAPEFEASLYEFLFEFDQGRPWAR